MSRRVGEGGVEGGEGGKIKPLVQQVSRKRGKFLRARPVIGLPPNPPPPPPKKKNTAETQVCVSGLLERDCRGHSLLESNAGWCVLVRQRDGDSDITGYVGACPCSSSNNNNNNSNVLVWEGRHEVMDQLAEPSAV